ncbi:MAG TPA: hypothetical protein VMB03_17910 [Bryobacteraceae bacterium]|nr:hypothetical protein [Bryobacteraceae bacterium]
MKSELVGPVRRVRSESAQWDLTNEVWQAPERVTIEEYRKDGKISSSELRCETWTHRSSYSYDDAGRLIETRFWNGETLGGWRVNEYDGGRLVRTVGHSPDGTSKPHERTYAPDGSYEQIVHFPEILFNMHVSLGAVEGLDCSIGVPYAKTMITRYDREDRACGILIKDGMEREVRRLVVHRDAHGRVMRAEMFADEPPFASVPALGVDVPMMSWKFHYDENGRQIEMKRGMFGLSEERKTNRYDDRGNCIETITEDESFEGHVSDEGTLQRGASQFRRDESRFTYKYDDRGNWIERVTSHRHASNPDFTPSLIESREIAYYGPPPVQTSGTGMRLKVA